MKNSPSISVLAAVLVLNLMALPCLGEEVSDAELLAKIETMYQDYRQDFPNIGEVTAQKLTEWISLRNVVLVDVRKPAERAVSQLPNSITKNDLEASLDSFTNRPIVVYCTIGYRSGNFTKDLKKKGVKAYNLEGGILAWVHHGGTVEHDGSPVQKVHVYGKRWSLLPVGFEAVW